MGIHNHEKDYERALLKLESTAISDKNKALILEFRDDLILENLSKIRLTKYVLSLRIIAERAKLDFDKFKLEDIKKVISEIQQRDYSMWTKKTYKIIIRRFFRWLHKTKGCNDIYSWISLKVNMAERKLPSEGDLLNELDIQKLLASAQHPRDKALISLLWESGARVSEIGNLCLKHISFDKNGVVLSVKGKTGSRKIRLISSTPYLMAWVNNHPFRNDSNSPLWINVGCVNYNKQLKYGNLRKILRILTAKAEIKKKCNPHLFRHSRATYMANHLTEFQMNQYFGWIQGSDMPSTYVHMSGRDIDDAILTMNGVKTEELKKESQMLPRICPRCDTINAYDSKYCSKCAGILDLKFAMELEQRQQEEMKMRNSTDELMNRLLRDKDVQKLLMEKLQMMA